MHYHLVHMLANMNGLAALQKNWTEVRMINPIEMLE